MPGVNRIEILQLALKDAERELSAAREVIVDKDIQTELMDSTLEVVRIALYGGDGADGGVEAFYSARARLEAFRIEEAQRYIEAVNFQRILRRSELAAKRLMRAKGKQEKLLAMHWSIGWLMKAGVRPFPD